jgi:hypothetical protein
MQAISTQLAGAVLDERTRGFDLSAGPLLLKLIKSCSFTATPMVRRLQLALPSPFPLMT